MQAKLKTLAAVLILAASGILSWQVYARATVGTRATPPSELAELRGVVRAPGGAPVVGALVCMAHYPAFAKAPLLARTEADGRFRFRGLRPGMTAQLTAHAPGRARVATPVGLRQQITEVALCLALGATVAGRATLIDGSPAVGARISTAVETNPAWLRDLETVADAEGRFALRDLPEGKLRLRAQCADCAPTEREIEPLAGATMTWDVSFTPASSLVGRVLDSEGHGVANARIHCDVNRRGEATASDALGNFTIAGIEFGRGTVTVSIPGSVHPALTIREVDIDAEPLVLRLPPGAQDLISVRGRALDPAGLPRAGVKVRVDLARSADAIVGRTDADGQFQLGQFQRAELQVTLHLEGFGRAVMRRKPPADEPEFDIGDIALQPAGRLRLQLTMADGSEVPARTDQSGRRVSLVDAAIHHDDGTLVATLQAAGGGDLLGTDLAPGRYHLVVAPRSTTHAAIACTALEVEVAAGEERHYTGKLRSGIRCRFTAPAQPGRTAHLVTVHAMTGEPVGRVWLSATDERAEGSTVLTPGTYKAVAGERSKEFVVDGATGEIAID